MYAVRAVNVQKKNWTDAEATLGEYFKIQLFIKLCFMTTSVRSSRRTTMRPFKPFRGHFGSGNHSSRQLTTQGQVVAFDSEVPDQDCDADELETINTIRAPYQPQKKILRFLNLRFKLARKFLHTQYTLSITSARIQSLG